MSEIITIPFTRHFIEELAQIMRSLYPADTADFSKVTIVFGGHRPAMFLRRELATTLGKPFIPPHIYTIDEYMSALSDPDKSKRQWHDLDHAYAVYEIINRVAPHLLKGRERFAQFLPWAREIIGFMEQLDLEAVENEALHHIKAAARIGFDVPRDINDLLIDMAKIRQAYHQLLIKGKYRVRGFEYLQASQNKEHAIDANMDHVIFANFFYVHRTEMTVLKGLFQRGKTLLVMQGDERRWPALKRIGQEFNTTIREGAEVVPTQFQLHVYGAVNQHAQAGMIAQILKTIKDKEKTVIVLPRAEFILPLLSAFGPDLGEFNISLGYPLKRSSLFVLLESIIAVVLSQREGKVYSRDYIKLMQHPLVRHINLTHPQLAQALITATRSVLTGDILSPLSGNPFIRLEDLIDDEVIIECVAADMVQEGVTLSKEEIKQGLRRVHDICLNPWSSIDSFNDIAEALTIFLEHICATDNLILYPFNQAVIQLLAEIKETYQSLQLAQHPMPHEELFRIFLDSLSREVVGFSGSPLRGLQVLGLFETRALNFDHVIVADVNEGVLPNLNIYEPLIPREVMIQLNLDRLELEEEIQRYGFMRLIACAKQVHLIYQDNPKQVRSRFVEELIWEKEQQQKKIGVIEVKTALFPSVVNQVPLMAEKTDKIIEFLKTMPYSPSSLNTYIRNPYEFYLNYVLGLRQEEDLLDDPDSKQVGIFVHALLERAFRPFLGRKPVIDEAFLKIFYQMFDAEFQKAFVQGGRPDSFMLKSIMRTRLERFMNVEKERCQQVQSIAYIERKFTDRIELPAGPMTLTYRIDRVDQLNDQSMCIIDYKTGSSDVMPYGIDNVEAMKSFQMPLYIDYLARLYPETQVNAALYHLRTSEFEIFLNAKRNWPVSEVVTLNRMLLNQVMEELLDINVPFINRPQGTS